MRRFPLVVVVVGLVGGAAPARASTGSQSDSGSGNSSAGSGNSSAGSGRSSADSGAGSVASGDASGQSADASGQSSDSGQSTETSSAGSSQIDGDAASAAVAISSTTVVSTVATTVLLVIRSVQAPSREEPAEGGEGRYDHKPLAPDLGAGRAILTAQLVNSRQDLGMQVGLVARSPTELLALDDEAALGQGRRLAALADALGVSEATVAVAWQDARRSLPDPIDQLGANRVVVRFLRGAASAVDVDPTDAAAFLWELERERQRTPGPAHQRLAHWLGVSPEVAVRAVDQGLGGALLADGSDRAALAARPLWLLDDLADRIEAADAAAVAERLVGMEQRVARIDGAAPMTRLAADPTL